MRLTVGQALVRFLAAQHTERDGTEQRLIAGCFGIFGHGNVAGVGQALLEAELDGTPDLRYLMARNEQGMVHAAVAYARMRNRLGTLACTSSIGPGATNMVTGAALATINRLPVLLLPGDIFATRVASPVLQELEDPTSLDVSVNDCFRPVSRFFDRINRPEQLLSSALAAMRVLTDPVETGAVTLALPQDVQAEAFDWPEEFFARRVWHVRRPAPAAGPSTPRRPRPCASSPRRRASPWPRRRRARGRWPTTIRDRSGPSAPRVPPRPTPWPATRTSSWASARAGATSPPRRAASSPTRTCAS
jgi:3D-(3,5/4)-trihydroxycyclohexane-1,2-dione acylhydrolase (decyclizing)